MQWLQSVIRLHADITKFLSSTATGDVTTSSSPAKPTASVLPQVQLNCVSATAAEPSTMLEIPVAVEMESDETETTASVETSSELNTSLETLSKELRYDASVSDVDHHSSSAVSDAQPALLTYCLSNCCKDTDSTVQRNDSSSPGDCCQAGCCHSNDEAAEHIERTRCSEYEAASVLSEMEQFATIAAAAACPIPSFRVVNAVSNTPSDSRTAGINTSPALPPWSSSFANTSERPVSGEAGISTF